MPKKLNISDLPKEERYSIVDDSKCSSLIYVTKRKYYSGGKYNYAVEVNLNSCSSNTLLFYYFYGMFKNGSLKILGEGPSIVHEYIEYVHNRHLEITFITESIDESFSFATRLKKHFIELESNIKPENY